MSSPAPIHCSSARKGLDFYVSRTNEWRHKREAEGRPQTKLLRSCEQIRSGAKLWRSRAHRARLAYGKWWQSEYAWWKWLPDKFRRVGHCETGGTSGATAAGNWHWDSGEYVSAFGIIRAAFPTWNGHNSPREQYEVAQSIQRRYSWSAWGCGGA